MRDPTEEKVALLLRGEIKVINIGLELFAKALVDQGVEVAHVTWEPPAKGDLGLTAILDELL